MGTWEAGAHASLSPALQVASPQELRIRQFVPRRCTVRSERTAFGLCKVSRDAGTRRVSGRCEVEVERKGLCGGSRYPVVILQFSVDVTGPDAPGR